MTSNIETILELQNLDMECLKLRGAMSRIPEEIRNHENVIQTQHIQMRDHDTVFKEKQLTRKKLEGEVDSKRDQAHKLEIQLNSIKTNEAYSAMMREIASVKSTINATEDRLLEIMEKEESDRCLYQEERNILENRVREEEDAISDLNRDHARLTGDLAGLESRRSALANGQSGALFERYERFFNKKKTIILVPLRPNGSCSGCSSNLPPQVRSDVIKGLLPLCDNCSRILYWEKQAAKPEEEQEALPES